MKLAHTTIYVFVLMALAACEKEVDFKLKPSAEKVVVEGSIETGRPPVVMLTKSMGFFSRINPDSYSGSFLHDAVVTVSDGDHRIVTLREYQINHGQLAFYIYGIDSADLNAFTFVGIPGKHYDLKIQYQGKTFEARTKIPHPQPLDSLWAEEPLPEQVSGEHPDLMRLFAQYTDPDTLGDRVRYFTKRNSEPFLSPYFSTHDDAIINGTTVPMQLLRGFDRSDSIDRATFGLFSKGDTVVVKWCAIDAKVFDFWRTLEFSLSATGNPFAAPVEVSSNISGGALGVWSGYGTSYDTLLIQ